MGEVKYLFNYRNETVEYRNPNFLTWTILLFVFKYTKSQYTPPNNIDKNVLSYTLESPQYIAINIVFLLIVTFKTFDWTSSNSLRFINELTLSWKKNDRPL